MIESVMEEAAGMRVQMPSTKLLGARCVQRLLLAHSHSSSLASAADRPRRLSSLGEISLNTANPDAKPHVHMLKGI